MSCVSRTRQAALSRIVQTRAAGVPYDAVCARVERTERVALSGIRIQTERGGTYPKGSPQGRSRTGPEFSRRGSASRLRRPRSTAKKNAGVRERRGDIRALLLPTTTHLRLSRRGVGYNFDKAAERRPPLSLSLSLGDTRGDSRDSRTTRFDTRARVVSRADAHARAQGLYFADHSSKSVSSKTAASR